MMFNTILPTKAEIEMSLPGDDIIAEPTMVIDSALTLEAPVENVFPWFVQLGKQRAGWYFPRSIEHFMLPSKRGLRYIEPKWQGLKVGARIPDYGGKNGYFDCVIFEQPHAIGYMSERGSIKMSWVLTMADVAGDTRVVIRLRIAAKNNNALFNNVGQLFDRVTIAGLAAGLRERLKRNDH